MSTEPGELQLQSTFDAVAGGRDVSGGLIAMVPLNDKLVAGGGILYGQSVDDAA